MADGDRELDRGGFGHGGDEGVRSVGIALVAFNPPRVPRNAASSRSTTTPRLLSTLVPVRLERRAISPVRRSQRFPGSPIRLGAGRRPMTSVNICYGAGWLHSGVQPWTRSRR